MSTVLLSCPLPAQAPEAINTAARLLLDARAQAALLDGLGACRPNDNEAAFLIQREVTEQLLSEGDDIEGWKCASPSGNKIRAAPIYRSKTKLHALHDLPVRLKAGKEFLFEPKLAQALKTGLPPRGLPYSEQEILTAVGEVRLALEIIESRYVDPAKVTFPELLAGTKQKTKQK